MPGSNDSNGSKSWSPLKAGLRRPALRDASVQKRPRTPWTTASMRHLTRGDDSKSPELEPSDPAPFWSDITDSLPEADSGHFDGSLPQKLAHEWALVLEVRNLPFYMEHNAQGYRLRCPAELAHRVEEEIRAYVQENLAAGSIRPPFAVHDNAAYTLGVLLLLGLFHGISQNQWRLFGHDASLSPIPWVQQGACDCFEILFHGALWRSMTALTLHADAAHVAGNMGIGFLVMLPLCRELGGGAGWLLPLLAGTLGNLLNCVLQGTGHLSLGASTAVFGAVGVLSALRAVREARWEPRSVLLPLGAGVTLLAFLGLGKDPQTDVGAHLCGFLLGLGLGAAAGLLVRRFGTPGKQLSRLLGLTSVLLVAGAWWLAFTVSFS